MGGVPGPAEYVERLKHSRMGGGKSGCTMSELLMIAGGIADRRSEWPMARQLAMKDAGGGGKVNVSQDTSGSLLSKDRKKPLEVVGFPSWKYEYPSALVGV